MPGYTLTSSTDFTGTALPSGWSTFSGAAAGDPGSQWASSQVAVSGGLLQLNATEKSNQWLTGGICDCRVSQTYGAFFVRSRLTGPGPTQVEMLWPASGGWPPEIDFDETYGATNLAQATLHYSSSNQQIHSNINIDMTAWHTWGVIWTPTSITYTVDGNVWGTVTDTSAIPNQPMSLHIQQQTWCSSGTACPTSPQSTDVDWIADYTLGGSSSPPATGGGGSSPTPTTTTTIASKPTTPKPPVSPPASPSGPTTTTTSPPAATHRSTSQTVTLSSFTSNSSRLSPAIKREITRLAKKLSADHDDVVTLTGYSSDSSNRKVELAIAQERANRVQSYLRMRLNQLNDPAVTILERAAISRGATVTAKVKSRSVVALVR
jgi:beta-glucanase (GH16 family)